MTRDVRAFVASLLSIVAVVSIRLHADTVQLSLHGGRLSLVATNATPAQIFEAWSRAGGVLVVNADQMPAAPVSITLDNVPEEQALDTLLRPASGYLAVRRTDPVESASVFDRIVILPSSEARQAAPASSGTTFPARASSAPRPATQPAATPQVQPQGIPQGTGVTRLVGADGQPVEDDQAGAPPPYNPGDAPDTRPQTRPANVPGPVPVQPQPQQAPQPQSSPTSAPAGAPRPGMVVPAPQTQGQGQPQQR